MSSEPRKVKVKGPVLATADWHVGDPRFLYRTILSTFAAARDRIGRKGVTCVVVGDLLTGCGVYRLQELEVAPENYQVLVGAWLLKELQGLLRASAWYVLQGNHDRGRNGQSLAHELVLAARALFDLPVHFVGDELILECGSVVLFHHGFGASAHHPESAAYRQEMALRCLNWGRRGVQVGRVCHGHTHWLCLGQTYGPLLFDSLGGFQRYERAFLRRTPRSLPGGALYLPDGEALAVTPEPRVVEAELRDPTLPQENAVLYHTVVRDIVRDVGPRKGLPLTSVVEVMG